MEQAKWCLLNRSAPAWIERELDKPALLQVFKLGGGGDPSHKTVPQVETVEELPAECHVAIRLLDAAAVITQYRESDTAIHLADIEGVGFIKWYPRINNRDYHLYDSFLTSQSEVCRENASD